MASSPYHPSACTACDQSLPSLFPACGRRLPRCCAIPRIPVCKAETVPRGERHAPRRVPARLQQGRLRVEKPETEMVPSFGSCFTPVGAVLLPAKA